jgi:hypothetical protein
MESPAPAKQADTPRIDRGCFFTGISTTGGDQDESRMAPCAAEEVGPVADGRWFRASVRGLPDGQLSPFTLGAILIAVLLSARRDGISFVRTHASEGTR